jgi:hypothetical protein
MIRYTVRFAATDVPYIEVQLVAHTREEAISQARVTARETAKREPGEVLGVLPGEEWSPSSIPVVNVPPVVLRVR